MRSSFGKIIVLLALVAAAPAHSQIETATVTGGIIQGVVKDGVASFKGIPFAAPPVGELRWKPPQPVRPWSGTRMADDFGPAPMQNAFLAGIMGNTAKISEDCLYLNVWTAAKNAKERRPVMVWIYGGAFMCGITSTPMYDGTELARKGVVLVSIAYREGPFGFLAHPELSKESGKGSGDYGIQDQVAALRWVKQNIARFGGDPKRVTIFGESAGGISVSMLTTVPAARGLFQRAISESGGSMAPVKTDSKSAQPLPSLQLAEQTGSDFFKQIGVDNLKAARALSADDLQKAGGGGQFWPVKFWPAVDGETLLGDGHQLYAAGKFNDTPILIGFNSDEGALFIPGGTTATQFEEGVRRGFGPMAEDILQAYPHATPKEAYKSAKDVFRDSAFGWNTWDWATMHHLKSRQPAYVYYFDHHTADSPDGATHSAEMGYVFNNLNGPFNGHSDDDKALADLMSSYWVNFATSGNPNGPGLPAWPAFDDQQMAETFTGKTSQAAPLPNRVQIGILAKYFTWLRAQETTGK